MKRLTLLTNPDECNLHCSLCFRNQRGHLRTYGEMPFEIAKNSIVKYASIRDAFGNRTLREVIPSTMGEPLLYSKFEELLQLCVDLNVKMNLTTNGTFPGKWKHASGMQALLAVCSDIKISTLAYELGGIALSEWRSNVERLVALNGSATVSLQVTIHRENIDQVETILHWAESVGVSRIKWNPAIFLKGAPRFLRERFEVDAAKFENLRQEFCNGRLLSRKLKNEGSLFFERGADLCPVGGKCDACPFDDEVWVWPDGHEDHCPNPERRWGENSANSCLQNRM